jgi:hypothetical protein
MEDESEDEYYSETYDSSHDGAEREKREAAEYPLTGKTGNIQKFAGGLKHARHAGVLDLLKAETREIRESAKERL